jgi:pyridoxal phosphate enzyme (YggS family)
MPVNREKYFSLINELKDVQLIAVSKTRSVSEIKELYDLGQRDFGENYVQELVKKAEVLPADIRWHFIGHLQTNKVKLIVPFVQLIQSVDSLKLLEEINKQSGKASKVTECLLQLHIASEESKFGFDGNELNDVLKALPGKNLGHVRVTGLMGMASFTDDLEKIKKEFSILKRLSDTYLLQTLSMGMTSDYKIAIEERSNMVRIGSLLFGIRN